MDYEGRYRVEGLGPGDWKVIATLPTRNRQTGGVVSLRDGGAEARLDLEFSAGFILSGRVERGGAPLGGALVLVESGDGSGGNTVTGPDGRFRVEGLRHRHLLPDGPGAPEQPALGSEAGDRGGPGGRGGAAGTGPIWRRLKPLEILGVDGHIILRPWSSRSLHPTTCPAGGAGGSCSSGSSDCWGPGSSGRRSPGRTWPPWPRRSRRRPRSSRATATAGWLGLGKDREVEWKWVLRLADLLEPEAGGDRLRGHRVLLPRRLLHPRAARPPWRMPGRTRSCPAGPRPSPSSSPRTSGSPPSRNPLRKVKEAILTRQLEREPDQAPHPGDLPERGGIRAGASTAPRPRPATTTASRPRSLTERQAAELAASLPRPKSWHPGRKSKSYQRKVRSIQRRMAKASWLRGEI